MATVDRNKTLWDGDYDWSDAGEEWSRRFGNSTAQWWGSLLPRIHAFVPTGTILELAPGFGRWSRFLRPLCERLILVDLSEECIAACQQRFGGDPGVSCHVNDGLSLSMVPDRSVDLAFSFDSLVHIETETMAAYLRELAAKLTPGGCAFLHHSNLGEYESYYRFKRSLPKRTGPMLQALGVLDNDGFRGITMTAGRFRALAAEAGLNCLTQEIINWGSRRMIDCISVVQLSEQGAAETIVTRNPKFEAEAAYIKKLSPLYASGARFKNIR
jgi:hypothetical protein